MVGLLEVLPVELMKLDALESSGFVLEEEATAVRLVEELELMEHAAALASGQVPGNSAEIR
jgi:hypothetical protein